MKIIAILAVHNRATLTENLLNSLEEQVFDFDVTIEVVAVDDGSTDRTPEVLRKSALVRKVHTGNGSLYWAASMAIAENMAMELFGGSEVTNRSFILWLNDDVELFPEALAQALILSKQKPDSIVVGNTISKKDGKITFGALYRSGFHPLAFQLNMTRTYFDKPTAFNGNFVLVPYQIAKQLGGINGGFSHGMADIEYGLRATNSGLTISRISHPIGYCESNEVIYYKRRLDAWAKFRGTKGWGNWNSMTLLLKSVSKFWIVWAAISYALWWMRRITKREGFHP